MKGIKNLFHNVSMRQMGMMCDPNFREVLLADLVHQVQHGTSVSLVNRVSRTVVHYEGSYEVCMSLEQDQVKFVVCPVVSEPQCEGDEAQVLADHISGEMEIESDNFSKLVELITDKVGEYTQFRQDGHDAMGLSIRQDGTMWEVKLVASHKGSQAREHELELMTQVYGEERYAREAYNKLRARLNWIYSEVM